LPSDHKEIAMKPIWLSVLAFAILSPTPTAPGLSAFDHEVTFHPAAHDSRQPASLFLGHTGTMNLSDAPAVFSHVFSRLSNEVNIYPTENYLYFRFVAGTRYVWGNLRLSPEDRDLGKLHFGYYEFKDELALDDTDIHYVVIGPGDGIVVTRHDAFHYSITHGGKTVLFSLNQIAQTPPAFFTVPRDEESLFRLHDESNVRFILLFNKTTRSFMYVADEDEGRRLWTLKFAADLVVDPASGFAFYVGTRNNSRKILVGVHEKNVRQNNYYDGPFDQLADNYIRNDSKLAEYIQLAYPYTKGHVNQYGVYKGMPQARVAIVAYRMYESLSDVAALVASCTGRESDAMFYRCVASDDESADYAPAGAAASQARPHIPDVSQVPRIAGHNVYQTYVHYSGVTFRPRNTRHNTRTTWIHEAKITFIPGESTHNIFHTYVHYAGVTYRPRGTRHSAPFTFIHDPANTFPRGGGRFDPGLPGTPGLPPGP
jgi:hypothetical protein